MRNLILFTLLLLLLTACTVGVSRPVSEPAIIAPGEAGGPPMGNGAAPGGEKVVAMATQTPTPIEPAGQPSATPTGPGVASTPEFAWPTPIVLSGVPMTPYAETFTGFSFQYPGNWNIIDLSNEQKKNSTGYSISLRSPGPTPGPKQQDGIQPGVAAIDITVLRDGPKTLEQAAEDRRQGSRDTPSGQPLKILLDQKVTLPSGLPAQYFIFQDSDGTTTSLVVTLINGYPVLVSGFGEQIMFTTVAGSIQAQ